MPSENWHCNFLSHPAFVPIHSGCERFAGYPRWPILADYNRMLVDQNARTLSGLQVTTVSQQLPKAKNFADQYEPRLFLKGELQTRIENWHDYFNVVSWGTFPKIKAQINSQQYHALKNRQGISKSRTMLENVLTLFDENGAIIISHDSELLQLLINFQWQELFWTQRERVVGAMRCYIFGHSIYEKLLDPYLGMTASSIVFQVAEDFFNQPLYKQLRFIDERLAIFLESQKIIETRQFMPLPCLGMPGWYLGNEQQEFYYNTQYFRTKNHDRLIYKI